jgi:hypothetical protein
MTTLLSQAPTFLVALSCIRLLFGENTWHFLLFFPTLSFTVAFLTFTIIGICVWLVAPSLIYSLDSLLAADTLPGVWSRLLLIWNIIHLAAKYSKLKNYYSLIKYPTIFDLSRISVRKTLTWTLLVIYSTAVLTTMADRLASDSPLRGPEDTLMDDALISAPGTAGMDRALPAADFPGTAHQYHSTRI